MGGQQAEQEMAKLQKQLTEVQMKYMSDPTPENLAKLQQVMTDVSVKMQATAQQSFGDLDFADILDGDEDHEEFVKANPPPAGKEKYLPIGALLITTNYEPWQTFAMTSDDDDWKEMLESAWGIKNIKSGREMVASLLDGRHYRKFGGEFRKFKAGQPHALKGDSLEAYEATIGYLRELSAGMATQAKKCDNIVAWDLDRACYLARTFHHLKWMPDSELFECLEKAAKKIKAEYKDWNEYILSILIGRAVAYDFHEVVVDAAYEVLTGGAEFLKAHPLGKL